MKSRIHIILAERRMERKELLQGLDMGRTKLWRICTDDGIAKAKLSDLVAIANALGCKVTDLFEE